MHILQLTPNPTATAGAGWWWPRLAPCRNTHQGCWGEVSGGMGECHKHVLPLKQPPPRQGDFGLALLRKSLFQHCSQPDLPVINAAVAPEKETRPRVPAAAEEQQPPPGSPAANIWRWDWREQRGSAGSGAMAEAARRPLGCSKPKCRPEKSLRGSLNPPLLLRHGECPRATIPFASGPRGSPCAPGAAAPSGADLSSAGVTRTKRRPQPAPLPTGRRWCWRWSPSSRLPFLQEANRSRCRERSNALLEKQF